LDPLSQGVLGSALPQSLTKNNNNLFIVGIIGFLSGMAPDLDIFIKSTTDPLLFLEFHRQFSHSLIFIPFGGLICASFFYLLFRTIIHLTFKQTFIYATLGYGTHGLLDACTSYGTLLLWPFSFERFSWNNISIVDPLFTLPILFLIIISIYKKRNFYAKVAMFWAITYLSLGIFLNLYAKNITQELINSRGHQSKNITIKPSLGNLLLWKSIYEYEDFFYTDGIRILPSKKIFNGTKIKKLNIQNSFPNLDKESQQFKDIQRFAWFSNHHLAVSEINPNIIIDARYSLLPNEISGLWGIEINKKFGQTEHVKFITNRNMSSKRLKMLWDMIWSD
jgi:inner membrane protein